MKLRNLGVGNQLVISFAFLIISITLLGYFAYKQGETLHNQTEIMFDHPLAVQKATANIEIGILKMRLATRDFMLADNDKERKDAVIITQKSFLEIDRNFKIVYEKYLGPKQDIDDAYDAFILWNNLRQKNLQLSIEGKLSEVKNSLKATGEIGILREDMLNKTQKMSDFSRIKSEELIQKSTDVSNEMYIQLLIICLVLSVLASIIAFFLLSNIRKPVKELLRVINNYRSGNFNIRSVNNSDNEIGILAKAFNDLLDGIRIENELAEKYTRISNAMLVEDNAHSFFKELLPVLAAETNSQIAAVYLLNQNKTEFELYESLGLSKLALNQKFSISNLEGEFGQALISKEISFVKRIPKETAFTFNTVSGYLVPREIVTIPILVGTHDIVAVISIASVRSYSPENIKLIKNVYDVVCARVDGILAYRAIRKASATLREQNIELETQRNELNQQSSELIQQNSELEIQKNQLKEASRLKTTFLSNMSHELRTPLNSVIALSGVLNRRLVNKIPEDEYSYIGVIERNGKHLLSLINDILDISRIEAGREEIEINAFDIKEIIDEVVEMVHPQAQERKIKLLHKKTENQIIVQNDRRKIKHILQNLIANAVKFTENGSVEINATSDQASIKISVSDTGIGISNENLSHIFDEFRQADSSTSRRFGGTGLGLSIARKYARLLDGDIDVQSELNKGSVFTLTLPVKQNAKKYITEVDRTFDVQTPVDKRSEIQIITGKHILLVEDSEPAVIQIKDMLESNYYVVSAVSSGYEALELLKTFTPDAMILDLMMPQMDGFELLESIRNFEKTKDVPVLILTAKHITKEDIKFLKNNNIHQLIQKGDVQKEALLQSVYSMVSKPESTVIEQKDISQNVETRNTKHGTRKPVILIVEDNADNITTVKAVLDDNFITIVAQNGIEGVEMAMKHVPDLILMDIELPEMDGIQAFKKIRVDAHIGNIPIIALTASAMITERETILAYGFDAYIAKPIDEKHLFETLNQVLYGK